MNTSVRAWPKFSCDVSLPCFGEVSWIYLRSVSSNLQRHSGHTFRVEAMWCIAPHYFAVSRPCSSIIRLSPNATAHFLFSSFTHHAPRAGVRRWKMGRHRNCERAKRRQFLV
jgi:hypothetical protein